MVAHVVENIPWYMPGPFLRVTFPVSLQLSLLNKADMLKNNLLKKLKECFSVTMSFSQRHHWKN